MRRKRFFSAYSSRLLYGKTGLRRCVFVSPIVNMLVVSFPHHIVIPDNNIDAEGAKAMAPSLSQLRRLETLCLCGERLYSMSVKAKIISACLLCLLDRE